jgi:uncharacterized damage-inducible protein DinB
MGAEHRVARAMLDEARQVFVDNVRGLSLEEALDAGGGYRSVLGLVKHTAGWNAAYLSFAFDEEPLTWDQVAWPRGLRDTIEPTQDYLDEITAWFERTADGWFTAVQEPADLDTARPMPGERTAPLREIVAMMAGHWTYHAGEINMILATRRGEAWEYGEEVEENHIDTRGHGIRRPWMTEELVARYEPRQPSDPS